MANDVFANGREVSCKKADGKSICAFPDVCMTPPENPATPPGVPVPYPNTGMAKDMTSGSKKVKISGKEVMLKNKSHFKKSMGDEAGSAAKKGVVTSVNRGKVYFISWSMDVKMEGMNVVRHLDMTTHNHASPTTNTPPWSHIDSSAFASVEECKKDKEKFEEACKNEDPCPGILKKSVSEQRKSVTRTADASRTTIVGEKATQDADGSECVKKARCYLRPYDPSSKEDGCCPGQTPHHIPPKQCLADVKGYSKGKALCVCMEGANQHTGSHGKNHAAIEYLAEKKGMKKGDKCKLADYNKMCAMAVSEQCGCDQACIEAQLNKDFEDKGIDPKKTDVKHVDTNSSSPLGDLTDKLDKAFDAANKTASSGR